MVAGGYILRNLRETTREYTIHHLGCKVEKYTFASDRTLRHHKVNGTGCAEDSLGAYWTVGDTAASARVVMYNINLMHLEPEVMRRSITLPCDLFGE